MVDHRCPSGAGELDPEHLAAFHNGRQSSSGGSGPGSADADGAVYKVTRLRGYELSIPPLSRPLSLAPIIMAISLLEIACEFVYKPHKAAPLCGLPIENVAVAIGKDLDPHKLPHPPIETITKPSNIKDGFRFSWYFIPGSVRATVLRFPLSANRGASRPDLTRPCLSIFWSGPSHDARDLRGHGPVSAPYASPQVRDILSPLQNRCQNEAPVRVAVLIGNALALITRATGSCMGMKSRRSSSGSSRFS